MANTTLFTFRSKPNSLNNVQNIGNSSEVSRELSDVHENHFANCCYSIRSLHTNVYGMNSVTALEESNGHHSASAVFALVDGKSTTISFEDITYTFVNSQCFAKSTD